MTNGLFLQRETVPQIKQDLIDKIYNNLHLERKQAKHLFFLKILLNMHINMQIRNVKRTTPETDLYAKFVVL